ncbi:unnamed protein product [Leptidea sinapis]|uniref:Uncharacterized protein n=1 Tax=Leptidea sinapis TaxID=189913 RepID=A0A5E4PW68_9NEOP|nr:unnamed protein product [Leptidea sinapis]
MYASRCVRCQPAARPPHVYVPGVAGVARAASSQPAALYWTDVLDDAIYRGLLAGNAPVIPLVLQENMGGDDHLTQWILLKTPVL